ncbi:MAG: J domain-containing protein [Prochlorococcaceae cyanobacterium]
MRDDDLRGDPPQRSIQLKLSAELVARLDALKGEYGLRSRGAIVERLLRNILDPDDGGLDEMAAAAEPAGDDGIGAAVVTGAEEAPAHGDAPDSGRRTEVAMEQPGLFDERGSLVLVAREGSGELELDLEFDAGPGRADRVDPASWGEAEHSQRDSRSGGGRGIDLPGFVSRRSEQVRRSLRTPAEGPAESSDPLPQLGSEVIDRALERAANHWQELYGKPAHPAVLEAAMVWLAQDIWPHCDQSEGRPFSWTLIGQVMSGLSPVWPPGPASFERVMVVAGILEDPFSASTLDLRLPTLIRRFVHRFRRRRRGTSFQTLEHTMTLQGALKQLQLPTAPGHRLTLGEIREAYREMALAHHPDSGGSDETMRRLNEAYQMLKELYRNP